MGRKDILTFAATWMVHMLHAKGQTTKDGSILDNITYMGHLRRTEKLSTVTDTKGSG